MTVHFSFDESNRALSYARDELIFHINMLGLQEPFAFTCNSAAPAGSYTVRLETGGADAADASAPDHFCYAFTKTSGFIRGNSAREVLLGVYAYLRALGFVFLRPGTGGTYVPALTSINALLRALTEQTAVFYHRGVCIEGADSLENTLDFIEWLPKNGFNTFFVQFKTPDVFFERWYAHYFNPLLPPEALSRAALDEMDCAVTAAMELRGVFSHRAGHCWTAEAIGFPGTGWRVETAALEPDVQDLVAKISGKRQLRDGNPTNTNLCYANPAARQKLIDGLVEYAKSHASVDYLHFWLADEYNNICECADCAATTLSDQYVALLNEADARLTREGLDVKIVFPLYQELLYAPVSERLRNPGRFCLMFAPISRTFETAYPTETKPCAVKPYVRNRLVLPDTVEENLTHYFNWKKTFDGDAFFYDYPLGRAHYGDFGYMKISKTVYEDIRAMKSIGSDGYISCQELRATLPHAFPNFVMSHALCDEAAAYDDLKHTYFEALLGEDYRIAVEYLEALSALSDTDYFNGKGERVQPQKAETFAIIAKMTEEFIATAKCSGGTAAAFYRDNWRLLAYHAEYSVLLANALAKLCGGDKAGADAQFNIFCDFIRVHELQYQPYLDVYRIIEVATKYTGFTLI